MSSILGLINKTVLKIKKNAYNGISHIYIYIYIYNS